MSFKVFNSLTGSKEQFISESKNRTVTMYCCGPTVYDMAHLGHARTYITFDIIRRIIQDYFQHPVFYVMNITNCDDKIINRAFGEHLFNLFKTRFLDKSTSEEELKGMQKIIIDSGVMTAVRSTCRPIEALLGPHDVSDNLRTTRAPENVAAKLLELSEKYLVKYLPTISPWKDEPYTNSIFEAYASRYETEFHKDMEALNVLPPTSLTRVTEFIPEMIKYVERILEKKLAYRGKITGSVYFDTRAFNEQGYTYGKLHNKGVGESFDTKSYDDLHEDSGNKFASEKKNVADFALWKVNAEVESLMSRSEVDELKVPCALRSVRPGYESPWGFGMPGWSLECSVFASTLLSDTNFDLHFGGEDLKFPHHTNELAQAEAYSGTHNWVSAFLHSGSLNIKGRKMSKSLKNFITIRQLLSGVPCFLAPGDGSLSIEDMHLSGLDDVTTKSTCDTTSKSISDGLSSCSTSPLSTKSTSDVLCASPLRAKSTGRQLRFFFLAHTFSSRIDFSEDELKVAAKTEKYFQEFFNSCNYYLFDKARSYRSGKKWTERESKLRSYLQKIQTDVDECLSDNFNYPGAMLHLRALVNETNKYIGDEMDPLILKSVYDYVFKILGVFGISFTTEQGNREVELKGNFNIRDIVDTMVKFQDDVRKLALENLGNDCGKQLIELYNDFRDVKMPSLNISIKNIGDGKSRWDFIDNAVISSTTTSKTKAASSSGSDGGSSSSSSTTTTSKVKSTTSTTSDEKVDLKTLSTIETKDTERMKLERKKYIERLERASLRMNARQYFESMGKFSEFDKNDVPIRDLNGKILSKSAIKTLNKEFAAYLKSVKEFDSKMIENPKFLEIERERFNCL